MTITEWLRSLTLERYAQAFAKNDIDFESVVHLSDPDLKDIGIPLGPRRRMMAAIDALRTGASPSAASVPEPERRHLTVLFADMVESTAIASRTDPETLDTILRTYRDAVSSAIIEHEGHLAKFMGDGVMAYFGWPKAREDSVELALRAGLSIVSAVEQLRDQLGHPLHARVGIASGLVVIGGMTGSGAAREENVAGDTPHLASRLQSLAEVDSVLVSDSTHRLVGGLFDCESLGEHAVKGFAEPVRVWRVRNEAVSSSRFAAVRELRCELVGRDGELGRLGEGWRRACDGAGSTTVISGEAGIGKSRLVEALHERVAQTPHARLVWQCSPFHTNSALHPVIRQIETAAGFEYSDTHEARMGKLHSLLEQFDMALPPSLPLIAELLSLPTADFPNLDLTPAQRKSALIAALADWAVKAASRSPLLLVLEDAHWTDPTTQELMSRIVAVAAGSAIYAVVTARPGSALPWLGRAHVDAIVLDRLDESECARMIATLSAQRQLSGTAVDTIMARSDGNPLYVEELTLAAVGSAAKGSESVPETLQDSLMARLDALSHARDLAQVASVIGRSFSRGLLAAVSSQNPLAIDADLSTLEGADIVHAVTRSDKQLYEFKHALLCDAAYESLTFVRRRELHRCVAERIETAFPDIVESEPELVAQHFARAGMPEKASAFAERAGIRAVMRSAYVEAIANYDLAIEQNALSEASPARARRELDLLLKVGPALAIIRGGHHGDVAALYERAADCAKALDELDALFKAEWGLWYHANLGRRYDVAQQKAEQLVALSERTNDDEHVLEAAHCVWSTALFRGDCTRSIDYARKGIALYQPERHRHLASMFGGHDPGVCAHSCYGNGLAMRGHARDARDQVLAAIELAEAGGHPNSLAHALLNALVALPILGETEETKSYGVRMRTLAQRYNLPPPLAVAQFFIDWADSVEATDDVLARLKDSFERAFAIAPMPVFYGAFTAERFLAGGLTADAISILDRISATQSAGLYVSEVWRLRGEAIVKRDSEASAEAESAFSRALEISMQQDAPLLAVRACISATQIASLREKTVLQLPALLSSFTGEDNGLREVILARQLCNSA